MANELTGFRILGEQNLSLKLEKKLATPAAARFLMDAWRLETERTAKANVVRGVGGWLWKGTTRQSITSERDMSEFPRWARVGSNLDTARWGELGTGLLSEDPASAHRRYFPPPAALDEWAIGHGFHVGSVASARADTPGTYGYLVAEMIFKAGGTKPRRFITKAAIASEAKIDGWLEHGSKIIESQAPAL